MGFNTTCSCFLLSRAKERQTPFPAGRLLSSQLLPWPTVSSSMKGINTPMCPAGPGKSWNLWKCDTIGSVSVLLVTQYIFAHEQKLLYTPLSIRFPSQILNCFVSNVSPAQGRVALDGPWPSPSRNRQGNPPANLRKLCLPNPARSGGAQVTSHPSLSRCGRPHRNSLTSAQKYALCLLQAPNPKLLQGRPSPYTPGGVGCAQPTCSRWRKRFSSHWNVKVRVLMKNTRWHSYAIEKVHHALPNYKEFRFFPKL